MNERSCPNKRLAVIAASLVGLGIVCYLVAAAFLEKPKPPVDADQVVRAIQGFCAAHQPLSETVTFSQLIAEGYLGSNVLRDFGASEVTVYLNADETRPETFLMDALMPDGTHVTALADGSVHGMSPSRYQRAVSGR